jgi:hypothetical protein
LRLRLGYDVSVQKKFITRAFDNQWWKKRPRLYSMRREWKEDVRNL